MLKMKMKSRVKLSENKNNKEVDAKKIKKKIKIKIKIKRGDEDDNHLPAFHIINIRRGINDPQVIAVRMSLFLYCNLEQITGTILWKTKATSMIGIVFKTLL